MIDTLKVAEDPQGLELIIRMFEAYGGRGQCKLSSTFSISQAWHCDLLEDNGAEATFDSTGAIVFDYTPFKIISLKIRMK